MATNHSARRRAVHDVPSVQVCKIFCQRFLKQITALEPSNHCTKGCDSSPCFRGVQCYDEPRGEFRCGPCPPGYRGDGRDCRPMVTCADNPCFENVTCQETYESPGYRCESCPEGFTGDGVRCQDIDECIYANPCDTRASCINTSPGFRCSHCPTGYTSAFIHGVGIEQARSLKQVRNLFLEIHLKKS